MPAAANPFPSHPHLQLSTEADLATAIADGLLVESHYLELKRELATGSGANRELARDVCSLAIDGGMLIVGIAENTGRLELSPQPLAQQRERVEQVVRTSSDPALLVSTTTIPSAADPTRGYLIVDVPVSPDAPHMVDNKYLGRSHTGKLYLSAPEVLRLHQRRAHTEDDALALLRQVIAQDPTRSAGAQAHLFLLAQPVLAHRRMLQTLTTGPVAQNHMHAFATRTVHTEKVSAALEAAGITGCNPDIHNLTEFHTTNGGVAMSNVMIQFGRDGAVKNPPRENVLELDVRTDGGLRLYCGSLSEAARRHDAFDGPSTGGQLLDEDLLVTMVHRFLAYTTAAAAAAGYRGNWTVAMGATNLKNTTSRRLELRGHPGQPHPGGDYAHATTVTPAQLETQPGAVATDLAGVLLDTLRSSRYYEPALRDDLTG